ncbi:PET191-like protein [Fusarium heterosporum]|uniref:PET191-like protein n=1 Tax=Fusarium heterosporum TaxID=42747 RepID=A0A8H5WNZ0_FUSHE|nr:PET191-like protein [Fusarium heterosporum]
MDSPQSSSPPSHANSQFPVQPVPASILAEKEVQRRDAASRLGACRTGCAVIDEDVLLGGFERASIVGISAEDEELGVQLGFQILAHSLCEGIVSRGLLITPKPASVMLAGLRDAIKAELEANGHTKDVKAKLRQCLEQVMLSCVFDLDGLWEVLADLNRSEPPKDEPRETEAETKERKQDVVTAPVDEIQDSQDDDDDAFSPLRETSQQPQPDEPPRRASQHPEVIVITHFSSLLTSLFNHRERSAAHAALQLLGAHIRGLSRNLSSSPLILLLNSTSSASLGAANTATVSPAKQAPVDPTLCSIFNPPLSTGYNARRTKPNYGLTFSQLPDLHMLCTRIPKTISDAEAVVQQRIGDEVKTFSIRSSCGAIDKAPVQPKKNKGENKMPSSCKELRDALAQCLQESDCVMVQRNSAADCLREPLSSELPLKCRQLKKGFGECKRGMVDMRKRFRGNMPVAYRTMEKAEEGAGYQLYAGRPAFAGGVKKTDGNEPIPQDWRDVENEKWKAEQQQQQQQQQNK